MQAPHATPFAAGWAAHAISGFMPARPNMRVDVVFRGGGVLRNVRARFISWAITGRGEDVKLYRLSPQPEV